MDRWKYFAISHQNHVFCNPLSEAKVDELIELLDIPERGRIVDIACGKAEFLVRAARRWRCTGVGVDLSPYFASDARKKVDARGLGEIVQIVEANGAEYEVPGESHDAAVCLRSCQRKSSMPDRRRVLFHAFLHSLTARPR